MEAIKILQADVLDILFENRNKSYGAYLLRKNYSKQVLLALLITFSATVIFSIFILNKKDDKAVKPFVAPEVITVNAVTKPKEVIHKIKIPKPHKAEASLKVNMQKFAKPVVSPDKDVTATPPKQDVKLTIGPVTQKGKDMRGLLAAPPEVKGVGGNKFILGGSNADKGVGKDFIPVEAEARFPGGEEAWKRYLMANLRQNIPTDNGAPQGRYIVTVSFLVSIDGSISDVKAIDAPDPDYGTAAEAVRVIMRGPKWTPAIQNGKPVSYHQKQKVIFEVQEQ